MTGISPVLLVADIQRSVEYFRDKLGFECEVYGEPPDFAAARRDEATLLLALCDSSGVRGSSRPRATTPAPRVTAFARPRST